MIKQGCNSDGELYSVHDGQMRVIQETEILLPNGDMEGSRTRQEFAEECDINNLMAKYETHGIISHVDQRQPMYLDLSEMPDNLADTLAMLESAKQSFMQLPAKVRREFDNDPVKFVDYAADPTNAQQLADWGLAEAPPEPPPPQRVEIVNPPAPPPGGADKPA